MIRVALVEDTPEDRDLFLSFFSAYQKEDKSEYALSVYETGTGFLHAFTGQFDLIFLDIELPDGNGLDIGREIRKTDTRTVLAFLTKMGQFAIEGYEVDASDYILKPLDEKIFALKMKKLLKRVHRNRPISIAVPVGGGKQVIEAQSILYVDVYKHDVSYHTAAAVYTERGTLKETEILLKDASFSRLSNSCLVNLKHVAGISKYDLLLKNGETLPISRSRKKDFLDEFNRFLGGSL